MFSPISAAVDSRVELLGTAVMSFLELDIRTFLKLLSIGNLVAMAMVFVYKSPENHVNRIRTFVFGRLFQSMGFGLISLRGAIPLWISAHLGNPFLFFGIALEMIALRRLYQSRVRVEGLLIFWVGAGSLALWRFADTPALLVVVSSFVGALLYSSSGLSLLRSAGSSRLKTLTSTIFVVFGIILAVRSYLAQADSIGGTTSHPIQSVTYIVQFSLLLVGTVGFLLLMKEADDQLLLDSERREREQRNLQSKFIDMLTHELRAALMAVKISSSSLKQQLMGQPPDVTKRVDNICSATDSMSAIVDRCREIERLDREEQSIHLSECNLLDVVMNLDRVRGPEGERLTINLGGAETVLADRQLLEVGLNNLIDNAIKYALPATPIQIYCTAEVRNSMPGFRISVENQVAAHTAPDAAQMFVRYFRGANAHNVSGTGLGLYLTRALVRLQGGEAHYRGDAEGRVIISLCLPAPSSAQGETA